MDNQFQYFAGIDWGTEKHRLCLLDGEGRRLEERWVEHSGGSLAEMVVWLRQHSGDHPSLLAAAIEVPRGTLVETLLEHGFAVFSINPKQLDRFRDRYSPAGAKDDRRDALVLADSLRTDMHCFRAVRIDDPVIIRLRELSRLDDELGQEQNRTLNRLREQFQRFFPQFLQLSEHADEPWLWTLFEIAPSPARARKLTPAKVERILRQHRIRRIHADQVLTTLKSKPLTLAPELPMRPPSMPSCCCRDCACSISSAPIWPAASRPSWNNSLPRRRANPSIGTPPSFCPCRGWEEKSPPRCSARPRRPSRNEITMPCAATGEPPPSPSRVAKRSSCSCAAASIYACATLFITGRAPASSGIRTANAPMPN
jgi:hypothetical protein